MALSSPSPFSLPLPSLTYITIQRRGIHDSLAAARLGAHAVRTSSFGRGLPKNTYGGPFRTPAQNTYGGAHSLPYPTNPLTLRSPKPNYGQLTSKGHTWGCFLHPPFWAHGQVTPRSKKIGGCNFGKPHLGHHGVTCPFFSFGLPSISGPPGPPSHYRYPTYRPQTHISWGKP